MVLYLFPGLLPHLGRAPKAAEEIKKTGGFPNLDKQKLQELIETEWKKLMKAVEETRISLKLHFKMEEVP